MFSHKALMIQTQFTAWGRQKNRSEKMQILILMTLSVLIYSLLCVCVCNQHDTHRDRHCRLVWRRRRQFKISSAERSFKKCTPFFTTQQDNVAYHKLYQISVLLLGDTIRDDNRITWAKKCRCWPLGQLLKNGFLYAMMLLSDRVLYGYKAQILCAEKVFHISIV